MLNTIEEAIADIKAGKMVIVCDDENRENEGDLVMAADVVTPEAINFMVSHGKGLVCVPVSNVIASRLDLKPQNRMNSASTDCNFTDSIDAVSVRTGISAFERAETIKLMCDTSSNSTNFRRPGHVFPLIAKSGGVLKRAGHTEAAVDLSYMAGLSAAGIICEILNQDGTMARLPDLKIFAKEHKIKIITIEDLIAYRFKNGKLVKLLVEAKLPTSFGEFKIRVYGNDLDSKEHIVLIKGDVSNDEPCVVRVHSECFTGDVFESQRCDCNAQLYKSLEYISEQNSGILLYIKQEGRGIGLVNKLKAYNLQDEGYDTVEANLKLGFKVDSRSYGIGAQILADIGVSKIKLLTNNPKKILGLGGFGIEVVERLPLEIEPNDYNKSYLRTKKDKMDHLLDLL